MTFSYQPRGGAHGRVIGIDMIDEMLEKARRNAKVHAWNVIASFHREQHKAAKSSQYPGDATAQPKSYKATAIATPYTDLLWGRKVYTYSDSFDFVIFCYYALPVTGGE
jgi:hypothetical protein